MRRANLMAQSYDSDYIHHTESMATYHLKDYETHRNIK